MFSLSQHSCALLSPLMLKKIMLNSLILAFETPSLKVLLISFFFCSFRYFLFLLYTLCLLPLYCALLPVLGFWRYTLTGILSRPDSGANCLNPSPLSAAQCCIPWLLLFSSVWVLALHPHTTSKQWGWLIVSTLPLLEGTLEYHYCNVPSLSYIPCFPGSELVTSANYLRALLSAF